jgi:hypothetical protein
MIHCAEALLKFQLSPCLDRVPLFKHKQRSKESAGVPLLTLSRWQAAMHVCLLTAECSWRLVEVSRAAGGQVSKNDNVHQLSCLSSKNVEWCQRSPVMDGNTASHLQSENGWHWHARPPVLGKGGCSHATAEAVRSSQNCLRDVPRSWSAHDSGHFKYVSRHRISLLLVVFDLNSWLDPSEEAW